MTQAARWIHLFLDVGPTDVEAEREFWAAATGWTLSPPRGENDQFVTLIPEQGSPWLKVQTSPGGPGLHLDLDAEDRDAALAHSTALGATHLWTYENVPVMRSAGGFLFCHTLAEGTDQVVPSFRHSLLDQICLDIPPSRWESECAFWARLTGREARQGSRAEFRNLDGHGLRILLQRLDHEQESVTAHPDFAAPDRPAETTRHESLGAEVRSVQDHWTVLTSPAGQVYCLTDHPPVTAG